MLHYLPTTKFDTVIENFDGSISVPPFQKKRFLYCTGGIDDVCYVLDTIQSTIIEFSLKYNRFTHLINNVELSDAVGIAFSFNRLIVFSAVSNSILCFRLLDGGVEKYQVEYKPICLFAHRDSIYGICEKENKVFKMNHHSMTDIEYLFDYNALGNAAGYADDKSIYITDSEENILRCYSFTGDLLWEVLTPYIDPIGIMMQGQMDILYGGIITECGYDDRVWQEQKAFFHSLEVEVLQREDCTISYSNAFEVDFVYEERLRKNISEEEFPLQIRLAVPVNNDRQKCLDLFPISYPFHIEVIDDIRFAVFDIPDENFVPQVIGYSAKMHLRGKKVNFKKSHPVIFASETVLTEDELSEIDFYSTLLKQVSEVDPQMDAMEKLERLRNRIYQQLEYKRNIDARSFEEVWTDGYGTCGDYSSLMLNFFSQHSIPCQSAGGYKVPRFSNGVGEMRSIYYNHAWVEVYLRNGEVLDIESSSDDKGSGNHFSKGQFTGLDWTHIKLYNGKAVPHFMHFVEKNYLHPYDYFTGMAYCRVVREIPISQFNVSETI